MFKNLFLARLRLGFQRRGGGGAGGVEFKRDGTKLAFFLTMTSKATAAFVFEVEHV